jgi:hypothetical protein
MAISNGIQMIAEFMASLEEMDHFIKEPQVPLTPEMKVIMIILMVFV